MSFSELWITQLFIYFVDDNIFVMISYVFAADQYDRGRQLANHSVATFRVK